MIACYTERGMLDLSHFRKEDYDLHICAKALSRINRFCGHTRHPYSVAQHAVVTSYLVPDWCRFVALHHDDTEAWIGDMPRNVKAQCPDFRDLEAAIAGEIEAALGLEPSEECQAIVKNADNWALRLEQINLQGRTEFGKHDVAFVATDLVDVSSALDTLEKVLTPAQAALLYVQRHWELIYGR